MRVARGRSMELTDFATQALSWLSTLVVIRLLHPEDYGLLAMATSATALSVMLNEMGLTTVIVQRRVLTEDDLSRPARRHRAWQPCDLCRARTGEVSPLP